MALRPRFMDTFAVLGLVLLLAVTPAYMAQDPTERELSDGFDLHFPAPRIGDLASLDLVFVWDGGEPVVIEGARTATVRAVAPGEVPVHARYVLEETRHPLRATLPWGDLVVDRTTTRTYYDGDGRPVWEGQSHATPSDDTGSGADHPRGFVDHWSSGVTDGHSELNHYFGPPVVFHASHVALIRREMAENLPNLFASQEDRTSRGAEVHVEMSNQAFALGDSLYLVLDHDPYEAMIGRPERSDPFGGTEGFSEGLTFVDFMADGGMVATGRFATEGWFMPIGGWQRFTDDEHRLDVWAVPRIERGPGDDLPVQHQWRFADGGYARPSPAQGDLQQMTLGALQELGAEFRSGLTLPELVTLLRSDAAAPAVQQASAGRLVAFAWEAGPVTPPTERTSEAPALPLPAPPGGLPVEDEVAPGATARDDWVAAFVAGDGHVRVVNATIETTIDGHRLVRSTDLCGVPPQESRLGHVRCSAVPSSVIDPARRVVHPLAALERIAQQDGTAELPDLFAYQPLGRYEMRSPGYRGRDALSAWETPFAFDGQAPALFAWHHPDDILPMGVVHWETGADGGDITGGRLWGDTGQLAMLRGSTPDPDGEGLGSFTPATAATASAAGAPVQLDVRSGEALAGSLILLGLWALVRTVLGVKAGAWAPVFAGLYAKIAKEDVLDHERRDAIVALIDSDPGLTTTEIGGRLGIGWGATVHHLETLRRNRLVATVRHGHRQHFFRTGTLESKQRLQLVYRRDPVYGPFLRTVEDNPGAPLKDIVSQVRQGKAGASRTGKRLVALGLLRRERNGREVRFYPAS